MRLRSSTFAGLVSGLLLCACHGEPPAAEPVRAVRTLTVGDTGSGAAGATRREYAAQVRARVESRLAFRVGGKIVARPVDPGARVVAGQVLARLDPADLRLGQDAARAALGAAQVAYDQTAADYQRYENLRAQGFISAADLERRNSGLESARALLDQARAQSGVQANQAGYSALVADAAGVITAATEEVGAVVSAGAPVLTLAHDGPRDVVFAVPEDQLPIFRQLQAAGGTVAVTLWSGGAPAPARVREVAGAADPATRTFLVKAGLPPATGELGQTATVQAELAPADGLLRVPLQAVTGTAGQSAVWLVDRATMQVRQQAVAVARPEGDGLVIASGLKTGDIVVTAGAHVLAPGQRVKFYVEPARR